LSFDLAVNAHDLDAIAEIFTGLAHDAGAAIMRIYGHDPHARVKSDQSPVCDADEAAEAVILRGLAQKLPDIPVVSEEAVAAGKPVAQSSLFILVDPLDGTREFLARNGEFTINLALVADGVPLAGVVYAPALERIWKAGTLSWVARLAADTPLPTKDQWHVIHARAAPQDGLVALASRSHADPQTDAYLSRLPIRESRTAGSSLKFCFIAEGDADVYPRFGPTMEWDTAAGDAILRKAGGLVETPAGQPFHYGKFNDRLKNGAFIAWGDSAVAATYSGANSA
jgi:3'(2'), 5'-bisphosphate nucleotidase